VLVGMEDGSGDIEGSRECCPSEDALSGLAIRKPPRD